MKQKFSTIGIDPGVDGAICLMTETHIEVHNMPKKERMRDMPMLLARLKAKAVSLNGIEPIVFSEKVGGRGSDSGYTSAVLLFHYGLIIMAAICVGLQITNWYPISWKTYLQLVIKSPKGVEITPAMRKQKTVDFLARLYPGFKFTKKQCDAVALAHFGKRIVTKDLILKPKHEKEGQMWWLAD